MMPVHHDNYCRRPRATAFARGFFAFGETAPSHCLRFRATFLVARKVLENWWYWLVIDAASVVIYWTRDLHLTALLFVVYVAMIPFGLVAWQRSRREQGA